MAQGIFIGLAGMDIMFYQQEPPKENHKSKTNKYTLITGGPAANAAITYSILGGKAKLVTTIGNSPMGEIIKKELADFGVEVIDCTENQDVLPSISGISVNLKNASRTIWSGQQEIHELIPVDLDKLLEHADFCFSDCNQMDLSMDILTYANEKKIPIVLDAGSWKDGFEKFLQKATDAIASAHCIPVNYEGDFIEVAMSYKIPYIAVTNGEEPIIWQMGKEKGLIQPPVVVPADTLGAGDVFHGAYCYFRYETGYGFEKALEMASKVAAYSVLSFGPRAGVLSYKTKKMKKA